MKKYLLFTILCLSSGLLLEAQTKKGANATRGDDPSFTHTQTLRAGPSQPGPIAQAISGYYQQGFENTTFPPTGWGVQNLAGTTYTWARSTAQAHLGTASAYMRYDATGGQDWLTTPHYHVSAATDSVVFWMRLAFQGYTPDSLALKISLTDSLASSFTTTLLKLSEGTNYPPNSTTWYRYAVSLSAYVGQDIYLAFKHYNVDGDGLFIDDVKIGTPPAAEVATTAIISPATMVGQSTIVPEATFTNYGTATQTFNVTTTINPGGYVSTSTINTLAPTASVNATFAPWMATPGMYTVKIYTQLAGDANLLNDTLTRTVTILSPFQEYGWHTMTALPAGRWATSPVFSKECISSTDTGFVYLITGGDNSFAKTTLNTRYNSVTGTYTTLAPIPASRTQVIPIEVNGKIYVIGGYNTSFTPVTTNSIYDIATNTWTLGAAMPTAVGDYAASVYNDSLIYYISGYTGSADVNTVQIYNTLTNTWTTGTLKTGTATSGGRMGITGNKIVFVGGYSQILSSSISDALLGTINPSNPTNITWTTLPAYPAGNITRNSAGVAFENNGLVYFAGGDPDGGGTQAIKNVYAYNTSANQWEVGPSLPIGLSNISGLTGAAHNDSLYLVVMGGYDGTNVVNTNYWLNIGPAAPKPYAENDFSACLSALPTTIHAYGGISYTWSPASSLSNPNIDMPMASPTSTTTYTVVITKSYGCPVTDSVTLTIDPGPTVTINASSTIVCAGTAVTLTGVGAKTYIWTGGVIDNVPFNPTTTNTYTVTGTDNTGCENTDSITIAVNPLPIVALTFPQHVICVTNPTLALTGGSPANGIWSGTGVSGNDFDPAIAGTGVHVITYTYVDGNNCAATAVDSITVDVCTNISISNLENIISVYPNPSTGEFIIQLHNSPSTPVKVEVTDELGRVIKFFTMNTNSQIVDINAFETGIYFVRAISDNNVSMHRILKK